MRVCGELGGLLQRQSGLLQRQQKTARRRLFGFCDGYEVLCSTSTTEKPAETLAKLAAVLPAGDAKRYRVNVSVVPLDEE